LGKYSGGKQQQCCQQYSLSFHGRKLIKKLHPG
jgi:hypothetical protein